MLDMIKIIVPVLTSLAVCYITIYFTNKNHQRALNVQQKNHIESMELSEQKHQEQLLINEENERLKYLPYLSLVPKNKINKFEGEMAKVDDLNIFSIPFEIINEGAGAAFSMELKLLDNDIIPSHAALGPIAAKDNHDGGYDILGTREPIETDVLRVDHVADCYLSLSAIDENLAQANPTTAIRWEFEIIFCDIQERKYSQTYSFFSSTSKNKIYRVNSYMPQLLE